MKQNFVFLRILVRATSKRRHLPPADRMSVGSQGINRTDQISMGYTTYPIRVMLCGTGFSFLSPVSDHVRTSTISGFVDYAPSPRHWLDRVCSTTGPDKKTPWRESYFQKSWFEFCELIAKNLTSSATVSLDRVARIYW